MKIYKIKRLKDNKFYRGRSKFTIHGSYFRMNQIIHNIGWVLTQYPEDEIELISYEISEGDKLEIDKNISSEKFFEILERNENINNLLNEDRV